MGAGIKVALAVGCLFGIFVAQNALADPIECECIDSFSKRMAAESYGIGDHLVFNIANNSIERYIVERSGGEIEVPRRAGYPAFGPRSASNLKVTRAAVPQEAIQELNTAHQLRVEAGGTINPIYVVSMGQNGLPGAGLTAYDVVANINLQSQIADVISSEDFINLVVTASVRSYFSELYSLASSWLGLKGEANMQFKVMGSDGSFFYVIISASEPRGRYVKGSARSKGGEWIPDSKEEISGGVWTGGSTGYGGGALDYMVNHLDRIGATISFVGGGGGSTGGQVIGITCAEDVCYIQILEQVE